MKRVVVLSGAGISAESGLQTFRGADDVELLEELEDQAREMADMVEAPWQAEGL